jgi:hypothetical protein
MLQVGSGPPFFEFNIGHVIEIGVFVVGAISLRREQRRESTAAQEEQMKMHAENKQKLETLTQFHQSQVLVNTERDKQISELTSQTATIAEMARGFGRRLEMLEDRSH